MTRHPTRVARTATSALFFWLVVCLQTPAAAPASPPAIAPVADSDKSGRELAARLRSAFPSENSEFHGALILRQRGLPTNTIPIRSTITTNGLFWQVTYETDAAGNTPAEKLTIVHTPVRPNQYHYARATNTADRPGPPVPLGAEQIMTSLAGSDFSLADLGLEFFHWPVQRLLKHEMTRSRSCRVLESVNPKPIPGAYARVLSWIDVETDGLIRAEAYDGDNKLVKEFLLGSFEKVDGQWHLRNMKIRSPKTRRETELLFELNRK